MNPGWLVVSCVPLQFPGNKNQNHDEQHRHKFVLSSSIHRIRIGFVMSSQVKTIMASHAEGSHFNNTAIAVAMRTTIASNKRIVTSSSSFSFSSSQDSNSNMGLICFIYWLLIKRMHHKRGKRRYIKPNQSEKQQQRVELHDEEQRFQEQLPDDIVDLKQHHPNNGTKQKRWQALVRWDPHLFPSYHGYYILTDCQGMKRFVKSENLLPSNKPRQYPRKLRFASTVGVKFIPHKDDAINADTWNNDLYRQIAVNSQWQQRQWQEEAEASRTFRRTVVPVIVEHCNILRRRWASRRFLLPVIVDSSYKSRWQWQWVFRRNVLPFLENHSHRLRWNWALQQHRRAMFQQSILPAMLDHGDNLRKNWDMRLHRQTFKPNVVTAMVEHSHRLRWKWALQKHRRANFQQAVLGFLERHAQALKFQWEFKKVFRRNRVPSLVDHSPRSRLDADHGFSNNETNDDNSDADYDDVEVDTFPPTPTRPSRQRPSGITPTTTTSGATVWIDGCRRSTRLQPKLGSIMENGRRRSARFL